MVGTLLDSASAPPAVPAPADLSMVDTYSSLKSVRRFTWSGAGGDYRYAVQYHSKSYSGEDIGSTLAGSFPYEWSWIGHGLANLALSIEVPTLPLNAKRLLGVDSSPVVEGEIDSVEIVAFRVQALGVNPTRHSPWSEPKVYYFVNLS